MAKHINYKTKFSFKMSKVVAGTTIDWTNEDWRAVFTTSGSKKGYEASYQNGVATNCEKQDDGTVIILMNGYDLEPGVLVCTLYRRMDDGSWGKSVPFTTGVELVGGRGDAPTKQDLSVILPYVYVDAYTIAQESGYKGTKEEYFDLLGNMDKHFLSLEGGKVNGDVEVSGFKALTITSDVIEADEIRLNRILPHSGGDTLTLNAKFVVAKDQFSAPKIVSGEMEVTTGTLGCIVASTLAVQVYGALITRGLQAEGGEISGPFGFHDDVTFGKKIKAGEVEADAIRAISFSSPNASIDVITSTEITTGAIYGLNGQIEISAENIVLDGVNELNVGTISASEGEIGMLTSNGYTTQVRGLLSANAISAESAEISELNVGSISGITTLEGYGLWNKYTDLNDAPMGAFFCGGTSVANSPADGNYISGLTLGKDKNAQYRTQLGFVNNRIFTRQENGAKNWSQWRELAFLGDVAKKATTLAGYGITDGQKIGARWENSNYYTLEVNSNVDNRVESIYYANGVAKFSLSIYDGKLSLTNRVHNKSLQIDSSIRFSGSELQKAVYDYVNVAGTANDTALANVLAPSIYDGTNYLGGSFKFYDTKFYASQSNTSNRCQLAYGYDVDSIHYRRYSGGKWNDWRAVAFTDVDELTPASGVLTINGGTVHGDDIRLAYYADISKGLHCGLIAEHAGNGARYHMIGLQDNPDKVILSIGSRSYNPSNAVEEIALQTLDNAGGIVLHGKVYIPERLKLGGATLTWDATNNRVVCDKPIVTG